MRLFHFSEDPAIERFEPRSTSVPAPRAPGMEWLNGPLVWAIDDWHQPLYLFPRECPRILIWPGPQTSPQDLATWWGERSARMIAHIEAGWRDRLRDASLYRYELPHPAFEPLNDAGMFISRSPVEPLAVEVVSSLPSSLEACQVELEILPSLLPLRDVWKSSMSASRIRLRNGPELAADAKLSLGMSARAGKRAFGSGDGEATSRSVKLVVDYGLRADATVRIARSPQQQHPG